MKTEALRREVISLNSCSSLGKVPGKFSLCCCETRQKIYYISIFLGNYHDSKPPSGSPLTLMQSFRKLFYQEFQNVGERNSPGIPSFHHSQDVSTEQELLLINLKIEDSMLIIFSSIIWTTESSGYPAKTETKLSARNQMECLVVCSQWQLHNIWDTFFSSVICGFGLAQKWKSNGTINLHCPNSPQSPIRVMKIETVPSSSRHYGHWWPGKQYQPLSTSVLSYFQL